MANLIKIDTKGDLTLVIGKDEAKFLVDSRALARASPVFERMLHGPFMEARPADKNQPWIVNLPEDNPTAASPILKIAHSQFESFGTPGFLGLKHVYNLLVFSEKYDMTALLRPWAYVWAPKLIGDPSNPLAVVRMTGVFWEMGASDSLARLASSMVTCCGMNDEGCLTVENRAIEFFNRDIPLMPQGILDRIIDIRQRILRSIFNDIRNFIKTLQNPKDRLPSDRYCAAQPRSDVCERLLLGSLVAVISADELRCIWANPDHPLMYPASIERLRDMIRRLAILSQPLDYSHSECAKNLAQRMDDCTAAHLRVIGTNSLTSSDMDYMSKQTKKLGAVKFPHFEVSGSKLISPFMVKVESALASLLTLRRGGPVK